MSCIRPPIFTLTVSLFSFPFFKRLMSLLTHLLVAPRATILFFFFFSRSNEKLGQRKSYDAAVGEYPLLFTAAAATIVNRESQQSDRARNFPVVSNTFRGNERGGNERETRKIFVPNLVPPFLVARLFLFNEQLHRRERGKRERERGQLPPRTINIHSLNPT